MSQSHEELEAAIISLLPLLEAEIDQRTTTTARWVSPPEPRPPGWQPPPPEPDCMIPCWLCVDFQSKRCHMREERWAATWRSLRAGYPQLLRFEGHNGLLVELMAYNARWASALYWHFVQPWREWHQAERADWARLGVMWLAYEWSERGLGWVPTYEVGVIQKPKKRREVRREWVAELLRLGHTQRHIMREVNCSDDLVTAVRRTLVVDDVR